MNRIPAVLRPDWSFDWYNWGGIVRPVTLEATSQAFIASQRIVAIPHLTGVDAADYATITATITVRNQSDQALEGKLSAKVAEEGSVKTTPAAMVSKPVRVAPGQSREIQLTMVLTEPVLWHFDRPHLYHWRAKLESTEGVELHAADETFGVRLIELKGARFYLNGEMVRLVGVTRHADSPEHGLAETVQVMAQDWDDLKRLNTVFTRPVHYPQADFILDYADRNGVLLIPEIPAWQLSADQLSDPEMIELGKQQLAEMIAAGYNHPSIWAWSVGNEFDSNTNQGRAWVRTMVDLAKSLDPHRPVGFASNRLNQIFMLGKEATNEADFVMMNQYFGTWAGPKGELSAALDRVHSTWPEKPVIISEFGFEPSWNRFSGLTTSELEAEAYYFTAEGEDPAGDAADAQRRLVIQEQMEVFRSKPFVVAAIFWTYQDYRTRADFLMGVVDKDRNRRGSWAVLRGEFSPLLVERLAFSSPEESKRTARITLRARGPLEVDIPAYTLQDYRLVWQVTSPDGDEIFSQVEIQLPVLLPGETWEGELAWEVPEREHVFRLSILRPMGFSLLERAYDEEGVELEVR
jgi:beta-glucuronidase